MTPELLAQDAAAQAERLAIEKARAFLCVFSDAIGPSDTARFHRILDERTARNVAACPHLTLTPSVHRQLGSEYGATTCEACGQWIPGSVAGEGAR